MTVDTSWVRLGVVPPSALTDARLQVHHAAQIAVSATISYLAARPDDSHTSLTWSAPLRALVTEVIPADRPFRVALRPEDLTLHALDGVMNASRSFSLPGSNIAEADTWLADVAGSAGLDPTRFTSRKHYAIHSHPVAAGAAFSLGRGDAFGELERYWSNAAIVIDDLVRETPGASPVRVWPHHFDIATLISLPPAAGGVRRTIGVGHSPGDEWYAEPYWYIGPYPYPSTADLPPLEGGHWHTTGWVGAAMPASDYVPGDSADQRHRVIAFVGSAVRACRVLLDA